MRFRHACLLLSCVSFATLPAEEPKRHPAPPYEARSLDGETFTKSSLKGRPVLIQYWATWCGYCRRDEPAVEKIVKEFSGRGLVVLAVNMNEPKETVTKYLADHKRSPKVVLSRDTNLGRLHGGSFPTYLLIDQEGRLSGYQEGAGGEESLRELVERVGLK